MISSSFRLLDKKPPDGTAGQSFCRKADYRVPGWIFMMPAGWSDVRKSVSGFPRKHRDKAKT